MERPGSSVRFRSWSWVLAPATAISLAAMVVTVTGLLATIRRAKLLRAPMIQSQEVEFREAGGVILCMEGPRFSRRYAHLTYELKATDGVRIEGRPTWFHAQTTLVSTARMELMRFDLPRPGRYLLIIDGLGPAQPRDSEHWMVFMRPHLHKIALFIVGLVLSAGAFIVSLVFFLLQWRGTGSGR